MITLDGLEIHPVEFASQGNAILGIRDSGKTYSATLFAERLFDAGIPFFAFDPIGVWRWLRVPGAGRGYPVVVAGGKAPDLPLTVENTPDLVRAAMAGGVSVVFDLFDLNLSKTDWRKIVTAAVRTMLHENRDLRHIFIEEAAEFIPQKPNDFIVYAELEKLARMGRNARLGYTLINQRSQEVSKAILELCENLFLHRQRGRHAIDSLDKWLESAGAAERREIVKSLPDLKRGQCWAWLGGDTPRPPQLISVPAKNSHHPDARALRDDSGAAQATSAPPVDVADFIARMRSLPVAPSQQAQRRSVAVATAADAAAHQAALDEAYERGIAVGEERTFRRASADLRDILVAVEIAVKSAIDADTQVQAVLARWTKPVAAGGQGVETPAAAAPKVRHPADASTQPVTTGFRHPADASSGPTELPARQHATEVSAPALRALKVLGDRHPAKFSRAQWATLAVLAKRGGTFQAHFSALRKAGYLDETAGGLLVVTPAGLAACAAAPMQPQSTAEVVAMWKKALGGGPARMIDALVAIGGAGTDRANLADRLGIAVSGGTFQGYLTTLRANGLIDVKGRRVGLTPTLLGG